MPLYTSSSEDFNRDIPDHKWGKTFIISFVLFVIALTGWESYWRSQGALPAYINSDSLWAQERRKVASDSVVFTGSSRTLFGIQMDVWERETGVKPIQLALEGTSPMTILEDLAADESFTGTVFAGVAPGLFFSGFEYRGQAFKAYQGEAPSQWLGQKLSMLIEPYFAFMDPDYALFTVLKRQNWPQRDGVSSSLDVRRLMVADERRNSQMWDKVVIDKEYSELAIKIWSQGFVPIEERDQKWLDRASSNREKQITRAEKLSLKFKAKGAKLVFLRMPSQGFYTMSESMYHPREDTWNVLLNKTKAPGIHFKDYTELNQYILPEDSHLSAADARSFTRNLVGIFKSLDNETQPE